MLLLNAASPMSLPEYVTIRHNTRYSSDGSTVYGLINLDTVSAHKYIFTHSFFPRCISNWNSLPSDTRSAANLNDFCSKLSAWTWNSVAARAAEFEIEPD